MTTEQNGRRNAERNKRLYIFNIFSSLQFTAIKVRIEVTSLFLILLWFLFAADKIFKPIGIRRTFTILFLIFAYHEMLDFLPVGLYLIICYLSPLFLHY